MTTTTDLVKRLEAGEAGREIDAALWMLIDSRPLIEIGPEPYPCYKRDPDDSVAFDVPPPFSQSLDSALSLLQQINCNVLWTVGRAPDGLYGAWVQPPRKSFNAKAPTPAAALIAALLKAKEAGDE